MKVFCENQLVIENLQQRVVYILCLLVNFGLCILYISKTLSIYLPVHPSLLFFPESWLLTIYQPTTTEE